MYRTMQAVARSVYQNWKRADAEKHPPCILSAVCRKSGLAVLHAERLMASRTGLADGRKRCLQAVQILDLALGFAHRLDETGNRRIESSLVVQIFGDGV